MHVSSPEKIITSSPAPVASSAAPNPEPPAPVVSESAPPEPEPAPPNPYNIVDLGDGKSILVDLNADSSGEEPTLVLELRRDGKTIKKREGWKTITHFDHKKLQFCDAWIAVIVHEPLGTTDAARVSLVCRNGEDDLTSSELAVFIKPNTLETIWAGLADHYHAWVDSCIESKRVTFKIIPPKTLEKTSVEETRFVDQHIDEELKERIKSECKVGTKRRVERTTLP